MAKSSTVCAAISAVEVLKTATERVDTRTTSCTGGRTGTLLIMDLHGAHGKGISDLDFNNIPAGFLENERE